MISELDDNDSCFVGGCFVVVVANCFIIISIFLKYNMWGIKSIDHILRDGVEDEVQNQVWKALAM